MKSRVLLVAVLGALLGLGTLVGVVALESEGKAAGAGVGGTPGAAITAALYELTIDGVTIAHFSDLDGIVSGYETGELEQPSRGGPVKAPGKRKPAAVTLERGMTSNLELAAWHELALSDNAAARKTATLTVYDVTGDPVARYHLENAWPSKLEVSTLDAGASELVLETVTFVADRVTRVAT